MQLDTPLIKWASQVALVVKNLPAKAEDIREAGSIPGLGRSSGGCGSPLHYSSGNNLAHMHTINIQTQQIVFSQYQNTWQDGSFYIINIKVLYFLEVKLYRELCYNQSSKIRKYIKCGLQRKIFYVLVIHLHLDLLIYNRYQVTLNGCLVIIITFWGHILSS